MRRTTRYVLAGCTAAVAIAAGASLVVLRLGRPLYYTDGQQLTRADDLADRPMQVFDRPLPEGELPGPVRGRFAVLPDGRVIYGRARGEDRTELVLFDQGRPTLDAVAVPLSSGGHDLAPCITSNGDLLFASDRPGGAGGFDIWRAPGLGEGRFAAPTPLDDSVNGPADEVDPALSPDGRSLVFVRRVPGERAAALYLAQLGSGNPAHLLWPETGSAPLAKLELTIDRDPIFTPDGAWLYFVRERAGQGKQLLGAPFHAGEFGGALIETVLGEAGRFSSPVPDAFHVRLLAVGRDAIVYRAQARLLRPYWDGQLALERWLWWTLGIALLLLALLLLGARWRALDIVTWCLLLSLIVHLLLWWLFHGVLLAEPEATSRGDGDRIALTMIDGADLAAASDEGGADAVRATQAERPDRSAEDDAAAPSSALEAASAAQAFSTAVEEVARAMPTEQPAQQQEVAMQDAPAAIAPKSGADALPASEKAPQPLAQDPSRSTAAATARASNADSSIVVRAPGAASLPAAAGGPASTAPGPAVEVARSEAGAQWRPSVGTSFADAPQSQPSTAAEGATLAPLAMSTASSGSAPRAVDGTVSSRSPAPAARSGAVGIVVAPSSALPGAGPAVSTAPSDLSDAVTLQATPTRSPAGSALRDATEQLATVAAAGAGGESSLASNPPTLDGLKPRTPEARGTRGEVRDATAPGMVALAAPSSLLPSSAPTSASVLAMPMRGGTAALPAPHAHGPSAAIHDDPGSPAAAARVAAGLGQATNPPNPAVAARTATLGAVAGLAPLGPRSVTPQDGARSFHAADGRRDLVPAPASSLPMAPRHTAQADVVAGPRADLAALYGNRFGPRKAQAIERFGGSAETERAVANGLAYLASIQDPRGHWGDKVHEAAKYGEVWVGKTALCTLAFLGAGHTPRSNTRYSDNVARALESLIDAQGEDAAHFGDTSSYSHGIATYALAECLAITGDERLRQPLSRAVAWILKQQNKSRDRRNRGGWGYFSATRRPEDQYARTSTTVWQVMALESAKLSGIDVPDDALDEARRFLRGMFDQRIGAFLYNKDPSRLSSSWPTLPASTPAAVFCLLLLGDDASDERIQAGLRYTVERRPKAWRDASDDAFVLRAEGHPYFWYCGSLACFLAGGDAWSAWNDALKKVFLPAQNQDGSFTPIGAYAQYADDRPDNAAFTTALGVLSLEVYYRYTTPLLEGR